MWKGDGAAEDVARVVEGELHVRRDVGYVAVLQRDRVFDRLADLRRFVRRRAPLPGGDVEVVEGEQTHEIAGRLSRVDRAVVAVFKQEGTNAEWSRWAW